MSDAPTFDDLFRVARDEVLSRSRKITRAIIERDGTESNVFANAIAAVGDEAVGQLVRVEAGLFLDSAEARALDRYVFSKFSGMTRKPAAQALGVVQLTSATPSAATVPIPVGTVFQTQDGRQFASWAAATYPLGSSGPVQVQVRSVLSGAAQQAAVGTITSLVSQLPGTPADLVVTNPLATAGAADEEKDDELRDRARRFYTSVRRGTVGAIEAGALGVSGVQKATALEYTDRYGRPVKSVQVIVSDRFTDALVTQNINPATYQTQSQALAQRVSLELDEWRAAGIYVAVVVAQVVMQPVTLALRFLAGVDVDAVALEARAAVLAYVNALQPGAPFVPADAVNKLRFVYGLDVTGEEILSPAGTVLAAPLQVIRTTLSLVVASTVQPDRALQGSADPDGV